MDAMPTPLLAVPYAAPMFAKTSAEVTPYGKISVFQKSFSRLPLPPSPRGGGEERGVKALRGDAAAAP